MASRKQQIYITALIPAHNEQSNIVAALRNIRSHVDRIVVACDNCSDDTHELAQKHGADTVFDTVHNRNRKAGALNQGLKNHINWKIPNQYVLVMDADTTIINPEVWFAKARSLVYPYRKRISKRARRLTPFQIWKLKHFHWSTYDWLFKGRAYDCVGSIFQAPSHLPRHNFIEEGQRLEWIDYRNKIERNRKTFVLTGTCSLISAQMLKKVNQRYHGKEFYNNRSLTEDFQMTIDLKECHARIISPSCSLVHTATKPNVKSLVAQRKRWYLGALQVMKHHKLDEVVVPYLGQQISLFISVIAFLMFLLTTAITYFTGNIQVTFLWSGVFLGFDADQVARVWKYSTIMDKLYSISMVGCLAYSLVLDIAYANSVVSILNHRKVYWNSKQLEK